MLTSGWHNMSKKLENLVKLIQKRAEDLDVPDAPGVAPTGSKPTSPSHSGATNTWSPGVGGSSTAIMTMQHALQDLAQTVTAQLNLSDITNTDPNDPNKVRKEEEAKARDAFGVFLAKNFMRNSKVPGIQYDPNPHATDVSKKSPDDPTRMSVVMDTMNRVGNPKRGEQFVDGNWGPRTNAAIRDAYAFASGLFDFVNDVNRYAKKKMQINSYNKESLQNLAQMATVDNSLTREQKEEAAPLVTQHVKAIKNMYQEVKNNVLEHPAYQQFIEKAVPYKTYAPRTSQVSPEQIAVLRKAFPQGFTVNVGGSQAKLDVDALLSVDSFKRAIQQVAPEAVQSGKITPQSVIAQIANQQGHVATPVESNQNALALNTTSNPGY